MNTNSRKVLIKFLIMVIITIAVWYLPSDFYRLLIPKDRYDLESSIQSEIRIDNFFIPFLFDIVMIFIIGMDFIPNQVGKCIKHTKISRLFNYDVGVLSFFIILLAWMYQTIVLMTTGHSIIIGPDHDANMIAINQAKMNSANIIHMMESAKKIFGPLFFLSCIYMIISDYQRDVIMIRSLK